MGWGSFLSGGNYEEVKTKPMLVNMEVFGIGLWVMHRNGRIVFVLGLCMKCLSQQEFNSKMDQATLSVGFHLIAPGDSAPCFWVQLEVQPLPPGLCCHAWRQSLYKVPTLLFVCALSTELGALHMLSECSVTEGTPLALFLPFEMVSLSCPGWP